MEHKFFSNELLFLNLASCMSRSVNLATTSKDTHKDNTSNMDMDSSNTPPRGKSACSEEEGRDIPFDQVA